VKSSLPAQDGVGASSVVLPSGDWATLLDFLAAHFSGISREAWQSRMQRGLVLGDSGEPLPPSSPYAAGSCVYYYRELETEPEIPFAEEIVYQDEHLMVADKPHFLPVMPAGRFLQQTLLVRLKKRLQLQHLVPLHRLDRGTAGLVLMSTNPASRARYQALFREREMGKTYEALAPHLEYLEFPLVRRSRIVKGEPFFRMREAAGEANSETRIEIAERHGALNLYRLHPVTGKQHQLRVHLAALGIPILNDPLYPELQPEAEDDYSRPLKLLARGLEFSDPLTGEPRRFESRLQLY